MGLAFGPAYGLVIYLYITYLILAGAPFTREGLNEEKVQSATSKEPEFSPLMTTETSHMIGKSAGIGVGVGLTVSSFFSVRTRCSLTLMIPSLVAKRGRAFMLTFAMGLLIKGPVNNIQFNLQELVRCFTCMYEAIKGLADRFHDTIEDLMGKWKTGVENMTKEATKVAAIKVKNVTDDQRNEIERAEEKINSLKINASLTAGDVNSNLGEMKREIDESSIENIRSEMKAFFNNLMNKLKFITRYWSKLFCLMVTAVIVDAIRYQKHYYTDNEFDNKMVDENLKRMWTKNGLRKLTPLRNWEVKKQEAQMSTSLKMTSEELERLVTECFPVILSSVVFLGIVIIDFFFASTISSFLVRSNVNDIMKHCLPKPRQTDGCSLGLILAIMLVCLFSCVIDAYFNRLRAQICNLFFPHIADKRARYLYK